MVELSEFFFAACTQHLYHVVDSSFFLLWVVLLIHLLSCVVLTTLCWCWFLNWGFCWAHVVVEGDHPQSSIFTFILPLVLSLGILLLLHHFWMLLQIPHFTVSRPIWASGMLRPAQCVSCVPVLVGIWCLTNICVLSVPCCYLEGWLVGLCLLVWCWLCVCVFVIKKLLVAPESRMDPLWMFFI